MKIYDLGPFRLDVANKTLTKSGATVALGSHAIGVLSSLIEHAPGIATKARIIDAVWPNVVVEEGNLATQIYAIRRVLSQAAGGNRWIETLSGRGYRYVGPIAERSADRRIDDDAKRSNLPEPLTTFIGREREIVELKRLLTTKRLVTIQGMGGIGKTRLALQVAAEVIDAYRDGAWLAELGSIREAALVPTTVAQLLGLAETARRSPTETVCGYLKLRQLLLVLDNCEHLIEACAHFVEAVLRDTKEITIIATTREPLRVSSEQGYLLQPLSIPSPGSQHTLRDYEAVQLFVERVQQQLPGFELAPDRESAVAGICVHLDGIPLALELAAARTRSLSVEQINARLNDRFRLLTGGSRTALPRQQTLRATLDWSYDLLAEDERTLLRRLAVFPGSFAVEVASAVASDERIDEYAIIDLLSQLVSRSLVIADTASARTRYRLLETTRAYAVEKLDEAAETKAYERRHAEYVEALFKRAPDEWLEKPDAAWHAKYIAELAGLRGALEWAFGADGGSDLGISLAGASGVLFAGLGLFGEGIRWCEQAIARVGPHTTLMDQARLWLWFGRLVDETPTRSHPALERAVELYRELGEGLGLGLSLARLARALTYMGRIEDAEAALAEARPLLEASGLPVALDFYFYNIAFLKNYVGDHLAARHYYERSLALNREIGDEFAMLASIGNIANANWALGDLDAAVGSFREQIALIRTSPRSTRRVLGWALVSLNGVLLQRGQLDEALAAAREGFPLLREDGSAWLFADDLAEHLARAGKLADAARVAGYADSVYAAKATTRHPLTVRQRDRLMALLREGLAADELARLLAEGAKLTEDEACRLALEP